MSKFLVVGWNFPTIPRTYCQPGYRFHPDGTNCFCGMAEGQKKIYLIFS